MSADASAWIYRRRKSNPLPLEYDVDLLFAVPGANRFRSCFPAALLAAAADDGHELANDLADYAAGRGHAWLVAWRRNIFSLVAARRLFRPCWRLDDLSQD